MRFTRLHRSCRPAHDLHAHHGARLQRSTGEEKEIKELSQKAAELDKLASGQHHRRHPGPEAGPGRRERHQAQLRDPPAHRGAEEALEERNQGREEQLLPGPAAGGLEQGQGSLKDLKREDRRLRAALPKPDVARSTQPLRMACASSGRRAWAGLRPSASSAAC